MVAGALVPATCCQCFFEIYLCNKNIVDGKLSATFKKNGFVLSAPPAEVRKAIGTG
jgi:hypothetical protein